MCSWYDCHRRSQKTCNCEASQTRNGRMRVPDVSVMTEIVFRHCAPNICEAQKETGTNVSGIWRASPSHEEALLMF